MLREARDIAKALWEQRFRDVVRNRLFRIAAIGACGFIIQATFFEIFGIQFRTFRPSTAALIGAELGIITTFLLNNRFSFHDRRIPFSSKFIVKFFHFNLAVAISLGIQWATVRFGEWIVPESAMILRLFNVAGVLFGFIFNYYSYTKVVWPKEVSPE